MFLLTSSTMNSNVSWPAAELGAVGCGGWGGGSVQQWVVRSEMDSHGEEGRTAEALYLEVRPLQKAKLGPRLTHRKTFSLDYTNAHREAHYREQNSPVYSELHFPDRDLQAGHMLWSTASQQSSTSPCHRTSPPPYSRDVMLSRRSALEPVRSDIIRGSRISHEDQEAGVSFNRRAPLMSLSSSEEEQEAGRAPAGLSGASSLLTPTPPGERRLGKRERNRLKSLRRRQRRRERCRQSQQENVQVKQKRNQACI